MRLILGGPAGHAWSDIHTWQPSAPSLFADQELFVPFPPPLPPTHMHLVLRIFCKDGLLVLCRSISLSSIPPPCPPTKHKFQAYGGGGGIF